MELKLPTLTVKSRKVKVDVPSIGDLKRPDLMDLPQLKVRGRASDVASAASDMASTASDRASDLHLRDRASGLAGAAASAASDLRDFAADRVADLRGRAADIDLGDVRRPHLADMEMPDVGKAVAPAAKALEEGITAVAGSFRSVGKGIERWRKPKRQAPVAEAGVALLAGVGGGMALMYFLDPAHGQHRRSLLAARLGRWSRMITKALRGGGQDVANRSQGLKAGVTSIGRSHSPAPEPQIEVAAGPDASRNLELTDSAASSGSADNDPAEMPVSENGWSGSTTAWDEPAADETRASIGTRSEG